MVRRLQPTKSHIEKMKKIQLNYRKQQAILDLARRMAIPREKRLALAQEQQRQFRLRQEINRRQAIPREKRLAMAKFQQNMARRNRIPRHVRQYIAKRQQLSQGFGWPKPNSRKMRYLQQELAWRHPLWHDWYWRNVNLG